MNQMQQQPRLDKVNVHEVMEKIQSKKEVYDFLTQECGAFLPKHDCINIFFLKAIMRGSKEYLKRQAVKVSAVPQIEGLTIDDFIKFAREKPNILKYLPDEKEWHHLDKQWLCDVMYTLDTNGVQDMINRAMSKRKEKLEKSQDLIVEMKPEFTEALKRCNTFSTSKGKAAYLLKPYSKVKRKRSEIEDVKEVEQMLKTDKYGFLKQVKKLKQDHEEQMREVSNLRNVEAMMGNLCRQGVINEQGIPIQKNLGGQQSNNQLCYPGHQLSPLELLRFATLDLESSSIQSQKPCQRTTSKKVVVIARDWIYFSYKQLAFVSLVQAVLRVGNIKGLNALVAQRTRLNNSCKRKPNDATNSWLLQQVTYSCAKHFDQRLTGFWLAIDLFTVNPHGIGSHSMTMSSEVNQRGSPAEVIKRGCLARLLNLTPEVIIRGYSARGCCQRLV